MKLTMLIESNQDPQVHSQPDPDTGLQAAGARSSPSPEIAERMPPLLERHRRSIEIMRERAECKDGTIFFDVTDYDLEGYNKFIPYYLHPECVYSVGLSKSSFRTKVSVGSNPWTTATPHGEPGQDLRALRRRRPRARGRDFVSAEPV